MAGVSRKDRSETVNRFRAAAGSLLIAMEKAAKLRPALAGSLILVVCQALTFYAAIQVQHFLEASQIVPPQVSLKLPLLYFFVVVLLLGVILFLIPVSKLRLIFRILFTLLYSWGVFIALALSLPFPAAIIISIAGGLAWLFKPRIWLHNLLLIFTLVGAGSVFGLLFSPWTFLSFMLVISIYDIVAVRFGYMLWLAKKLSESEVLPAFVIPRKAFNWNLDLKGVGFKNVMEGELGEREFSILGGGDIGFPLMLVTSVFSSYGLTDSLVVATFSVFGLISAYCIQLFLLKGKPMPALPPICFLSLIGFVIVYFG